MTKKFVFSEGHGKGKQFNRGFIGGNEGDNNLMLSNEIINELEKNYIVDTYGIRRNGTNKDYSLTQRSSLGSGSDLFYSVHSNAFNGSVSGVEIILSFQSLKHYKLAQNLCKIISETLSIPNRGVKFRNRNNGNFLNYNQAKTNIPNWYGELFNNRSDCAMIVEHFFHDNKNDVNKFFKNKDKLVKNIADELASYFKLQKKKVNNDIFYRVVTDSYQNIENAKKRQKELKEKGIETFITPFEI